MSPVLVIAGHTLREGLRNRWVLCATLLLAALALAVVFLGSAPGGSVGAARLTVVGVSLASLSVFLLPLVALLLGFDAIVGEAERGTLLLLLAGPGSRWQVMAGKFCGHLLILSLATIVGYGAAAAAILVQAPGESGAVAGFVVMVVGAVALGAVFLGFAYLISTLVGERGTAAGVAVLVWLGFVVLYDLVLLASLAADGGRLLSPGLLRWLLLFNPGDVYRLLTLAGAPDAQAISGLTGLLADAGIARSTLVLALLVWVMLPLGLAVAVFSRRQW